MKIIALSSYGSEHLPLFMKELSLQGIELQAVLLDGEVRERNKEIQLERTKGYFLWPNFTDVEEYMTPMYIVQDHNGIPAQAILEALKPDVIINAGTPRKVGEALLKIPSIGVVNVHPGQLPTYQGQMCPEWAIYNNDPIIMTCHFMTQFYDDGPIVLERQLRVKKGDIWQKVRANILYETARLMGEGLRKIEVQGLHPKDMPSLPQGDFHKRMTDIELQKVKDRLEQGTYAHYA
jgi:methionyl-tRNA formyltransferase